MTKVIQEVELIGALLCKTFDPLSVPFLLVVVDPESKQVITLSNREDDAMTMIAGMTAGQEPVYSGRVKLSDGGKS